ncbi:unnamed protein product [Amoebophrya sp. A25]|nr:unnamed protein product [Amoebophrya sp. A25]|eukprot:GSA25T00026381001.1
MVQQTLNRIQVILKGHENSLPYHFEKMTSRVVNIVFLTSHFRGPQCLKKHKQLLLMIR